MKANQPLILRFTHGPMKNRQFTILPGEVYMIGSQSESDIRVDGDPTVSRRHACLQLNEKGYLEIIELGSTNGTFIDGKKIKKQGKVRSGQTLQIGLNTACSLKTWESLESSLPPGLSAGFDLIPQKLVNPNKNIKFMFPMWFTVGGFCIGGICFGLWQAYDSPSNVFARTVPFEEQNFSKSESIKINLNTDRLSSRVDDKFQQNKNTDVPLIAGNFVWDEIINISQKFGETPPSAMDSRFVKEVENWIQFYTKNNSHVELLKRRDSVWDKIQSILQAHGLPSELGYIAWVESAFDPQATSHAGAAGIWQFISSTAAEYGLTPLTGDSLDQRRSLEASTHAAAKYLNSLLQQFGNRHYLLALAAYNAGQNKIKRHEIRESLKNAKQADFWHLKELLPKETQDYVPKVLAAIIIGRNPEIW